ncbi:MAG TPA: phage/plasmid primase, P4 family [Anaerolineae bacterium]
MSDDCLEAALAYAGRGWAVFPLWWPRPDGACACGDPGCTSCGKHPLGACAPHGMKDATTDPETIRTWWRRFPEANVAIATGQASGLIVIDEDSADAGREGLRLGGYPETPAVTTGRGRHIYLALPADGKAGCRTRLLPDTDLKGEGGYVAAPPSRHRSGRRYAWSVDPAAAPLAPAPAWLLPLLAGRDPWPSVRPEGAPPDGLRPAPARPAPPRGVWPWVGAAPAGGEPEDPVPPGTPATLAAEPRPADASAVATPPQTWSRPDPRDVAYAQAALASEAADLARQTEGTRNDALYRAGFKMAGFVRLLGRWPIEDALIDAALQTGLERPEIERTLKSAIDAGIAFPRAVPDRQPPPAHPNGQAQPRSGDGKPPHAGAPAAGGRRPPRSPTDPQLVARWLEAHPGMAWGMGEFRRYEGGIWPVVPGDHVRKGLLEVLEAAQTEGLRPTAARLASVLELARVKLSREAALWDADPDVIICANGALHIPTRTLRPHDPEDYATSGLSFAYDPAAAADAWNQALSRCAPEVAAFLQEFAGYALTTETSFEIALWLFGQPGGGKSTFLEGVRTMLGERACLLGLADIEKSRFALANLPGKTLAISTEQPGGYLQATQVLNAIISGEPITVERKFHEAVTIVPHAKVAWALNELPRVGSDGSGLFRRVKVVSFPAIPEGERDPQLKEQVKREGAGILNWALDGLARLRARGRFEIPDAVREATAEFRETNDIPALFVAERCLTGVNAGTGTPYRTQGGALYQAYRDWCIANGHKPASATSVAADWRRLGFERYLVSGKGWWRGVGLVDG